MDIECPDQERAETIGVIFRLAAGQVYSLLGAINGIDTQSECGELAEEFLQLADRLLGCGYARMNTQDFLDLRRRARKIAKCPVNPACGEVASIILEALRPSSFTDGDSDTEGDKSRSLVSAA